MDDYSVGHSERWIAALGAFAGILATAWISSRFLSYGDTLLMVGSMGASAVLLFAVPHGQLSQPWPATSGQLISAIVGVSCAHWIPMQVLAAAAAVSLAVLTMHYARCLHPPGGATALAAVMGGHSIHALGYGFVYKPVMINAMTILAITFVFNNLFSRRRYPAFIQPKPQLSNRQQIELEDITHALKQLDSPIDVTESDLLEIAHRAEMNARLRAKND